MILIVMGVAGCGKTTVGEALAEALGLPFLEGDALHPEHNIQKMSRGQPLDDADRWPWLDAIGNALSQMSRHAPGAVASCSALKRHYRTRILHGCPGARFVLLHGPRELLEQRLAGRQGHFMPEALLDSQLESLELPGDDEPVLSMNIARPVAVLVNEIRAALDVGKPSV